MDNTSQNTGFITPQSFASSFPALSAKLATDMATKTGLDPKDPQNIISAMHSKEFQTQAMKAAEPDVTNSQLFQKPNFAPTTAPISAQVSSVYDAKENNLNSLVDMKRQIFSRQQEASNQLAELSSFDRSEYKNSRLKQLNPTSDIDQRMLELRLQAFTAASMLETDPEIMALPPNLQQRAIESKKAVFSDAISSLAKIRNTRLAAAEDQIDGEISGRERQINTAKSRLSSLDSQIKYLSDIGADQDAIASLRLDRIKEQERLTKVRSKAGGISTQKEFIYQGLVAEYREEHGAPPTGGDAETLRYQAEQIAASGTAIPTHQPNYTLQDGAFGPVEKSNAISKINSPFKSAGFGIPLSVKQVMDMRAKDLSIKKAESDIAYAEKKLAK